MFFQENIEKSSTEYFQVLYRNIKNGRSQLEEENKSFCPYDTRPALIG
jgi:hypothetical protein